MGALPGGGFLTESWFDVERYRNLVRRAAVVRRPERPVLVLGSTQPSSVVVADPGVPVVRRRSGGGAVLVVPGETVWLDLWVPRDDPLWTDDVVRTAERAGEWWAAGLGALTGMALDVHRGASEPRPLSDLVCFAGVGPGEVLASGRKVVGLAQWRSREGALVHGALYRHWDPAGLARSLGIEDVAVLARAAVGLGDLCGDPAPDVEAVAAAVLGALPGGPEAWRPAGVG